MILMSFAASSTSLTSAASPTSEAALSSSAWFHQKYLKSNYLASKWPALVQLLGMKPQKKPCFREFREHFYWRLWRPASAFKIYSKGCESNGEALWICQCRFFLSTYWFSDIFSPFKNLLLRWDTLYVVGIDRTFGSAELFGRTSTVRFGPNDRTFFCRTFGQSLHS